MLAHADSCVKGALGRRDVLLALFDALPRLQPGSRLKALRALQLLTFDPALLQPLQVRGRASNHP